MKAKLLPILIAGLFSGGALAQDGTGFKVTGSVGVGYLGNSESAKDAAKLNEYQDLSDGFSGLLELRGRSDKYFLDFYGENIGRDDMYLNLRGGQYNAFKYQLYGNWLTHNYGFGPDGARTPYAGAGGTTLTATFPALNSNVPPWNSFNFSVDRKDYGGNFEFSGGTPWYARVDANEVISKGTKPMSAAQGTSPGNGFVELPYPVDFKTKNIIGEAGYQTPKAHFAINYAYSKFENANELLNWTNGFFNNRLDTSNLDPDNSVWRIAANGVLRQLPYNSTLSGRVTYGRLSSYTDVRGVALNTGGVLSPTGPSSSTYNGDVKNTTASVAWSAYPMRQLDTRVYYNYIDRDDSSTEMSFNAPAGLNCSLFTPPLCTNERYSFTKHNPGFELGYRLTPGNRISGGYDYLHTTRTRVDAEKTDDNKFFVQWANSTFETVSFRVKYEYLSRRSEFGLNNAGTGPNDPFYLERFVRRYDVADLNRNLIKLFGDWTPMPLLDVAGEVYLKWNDYRDTTLGRTNDDRQELYGSVSYGDPSVFRVTLFGDIEWIQYKAFHRTINNLTAGGAYDPNTPPTAQNFNWNSKNNDKNWMIGIGADWPVMPKLTVKASAYYAKTEGTADFQAQTLANGAPAAILVPINAYDNTKRTSFNIRGVYEVTRQFEVTAGYAYEKYDYSDAQYDNFQYTVGTGTSASYLTGVYAFPDYKANILFLQGRYKF